jgi:hypothetical protein
VVQNSGQNYAFTVYIILLAQTYVRP